MGAYRMDIRGGNLEVELAMDETLNFFDERPYLGYPQDEPLNMYWYDVTHIIMMKELFTFKRISEFSKRFLWKLQHIFVSNIRQPLKDFIVDQVTGKVTKTKPITANSITQYYNHTSLIIESTQKYV